MESFLVLVLHRSTAVKIITWYIKYKAGCNERVVCVTHLGAGIFTWMQLVLVSHVDSLLGGLFWEFFICISYHIGKMVFLKIAYT